MIKTFYVGLVRSWLILQLDYSVSSVGSVRKNGYTFFKNALKGLFHTQGGTSVCSSWARRRVPLPCVWCPSYGLNTFRQGYNFLLCAQRPSRWAAETIDIFRAFCVFRGEKSWARRRVPLAFFCCGFLSTKYTEDTKNNIVFFLTGWTGWWGLRPLPKSIYARAF